MAAGKKKQGEKNPNSPGTEPSLRKSAEEKLALIPKRPGDLKGQTVEQLVHELRVHQIELETKAEELRRAHLALEESRDKYLDLYEFAPVGYLTLTDNALNAEVNLTGAVLLGAERKNLIRARFGKFIAPQDQDSWYRCFTGILRQDDRQSCTLTIVPGDGAAFPARLEGIRLTDSNEKTISVRLAVSDISDIRHAEKALNDARDNLERLVDERTDQLSLVNRDLRAEVAEREKAEATLRESEERFRMLLQQIPSVAVQGYGMDGTTQYWNAASETLYGYTADEAIGKNLVELIIPPEMQDDVRKAIAFMADTGQPIPASELSLMKKDGSRVVVFSSHAIIQRSSGGKELFCIDIDLTGRRQAEAALRNSEEKFRSLVEHALEGILILDLQGTIRFANNSAARTIEADDCAGLIGRNVMEFIAPESREDVARDFIEVAQGHDAYVAQYHAISAKGNKFWVESIGKVISYEGKPADLISIRDITGRKRAEEALRESKEELEQNNRYLTALNRMERGFAELPSGQHVEKTAAKMLSEMSGAVVTVFTIYNPVKRQLEVSGIELAPGVLGGMPGAREMALRLLGMPLENMHYPISEEMCRDISQSIIGTKKTITELSYGQIPPFISASIQSITGIDHFLHIAHVIDGDLYGTSVIGIRSGQADPPTELLESFAHIVAASLRRQQAEGALRESEEKFRDFFNNAGDAIVIHDMQGRFLEVNDVICRRLGYSREELLGMNPRDIDEPEFSEHVQDRIGTLQQTGHLVFETVHRGKNGIRIPAEVSSHLITYHGEPAILSTARDITERKRADDALRLAHERIRFFVDANIIGTLVGDPSGKILEANDYYLHLIGYSRDEFEQGMVNWRAITPPEWLAADEQALLELRMRGICTPYEKEYVRKDKTRVSVFLSDAMLPGPKEQIVAFVLDITKRKRAEEALRASEERYRTLINTLNEGILVIDKESVTTFANPKMAEILGYTVEERTGRSLFAFMDDEGRKTARRNIERRQQGIKERHDFEFLKKDGTRIYASLESTPLKDKDGEYLGTIAGVIDITERSVAEKVIHDLNAYNRSLIEASLDPLVTISPDGKITDVNAATEQMTGYPREHLLGTDFSDYFTDPEKARNGYRKVFEQGIVQDYPLEIKNREGIVRQILYNAAIYRDEADHVKGVIAAAHDITRRKHDEDVLTLSNRIFSIANLHQEIAPMLDDVVHVIQEFTGCDSVGIRLLDPEGYILYTSYAGFTDCFDNRESPFNILKDECMCICVIRGDTNPDLPVITPKGSFWCNGTTKFLAGVSDADKGRTRIVCNKAGYEAVALVTIKQGEKILGLIHLADHWEGMVPIGKVEVLEDCSQALGSAIQRLMAETETRHSLAEKDVLLQEIHHRVKNNLAGIIALIDLQKDTLTDPVNISLLQDLETRVRSMALVHESLYLTKDLAQINFAEYSENLIRYLFQVYGTRVDIRYRIDMGDVKMPIGTAIPCGLVMSEIVTNALKYAFPDTFSCNGKRDEPCTIALTLSREGKDYCLTISDNGIGIPKGSEGTATHSLGLYLIGFIVKHQLRGTLEINPENGTAYMIRFSEPEGKERKDDG